MKCRLAFLNNKGLLILLLFCYCSQSIAQTIDFGKTYYNITKGAMGGSIETGDTIEIRSTITVKASFFDSCAYYDVVPSGTSYIAGTIRVLTNEGKLYKQFTDAFTDDCGWIVGPNIRINLGYGDINPAANTTRGRIASSHKPSLYGSSCIMMASFRVRVTAALNSNINFGGGSMTYQTGLSAVQVFSFPTNFVKVYSNTGLCSNTSGANIFTAETNGSFGTGRPRNRTSASTSVPAAYSKQAVDIGFPYDYSYSIANNTSTRSNYTTSNNWPKPDLTSPTHRVFSAWDIIGDHTNAISLTAGNPAADTVVNANGGYMLVFNSAYRLDSVIQQTISGLCPNTYYEISAWFRNICSKCGCDSNGKGAIDPAGPPYYIPTAIGDSSGVHPNIVFEVNGVDYYSTGNMRYTGQWIKKGFCFLTGPTQTSFTLKLFNNAPGGGGNDWAMDDLAISSCSPVTSYGPSTNPTVCYGNPVELSDTVRSAFNVYMYYLWQRSTNSGGTWTTVSGSTSSATPLWNGSTYEYVAEYTVPPSQTLLEDSADQYRVIVASTTTNLGSSTCGFASPGIPITLNIIDCGIPLTGQFLSFNGKLENTRALLEWNTMGENESTWFEVERGVGGHHFEVIGKVNGRINISEGYNTYNFIDDQLPGDNMYYRVRMLFPDGYSVYTRTIQLIRATGLFQILRSPNPFGENLYLEIGSEKERVAHAELVDATGRVLLTKDITLIPGTNSVQIPNTGGLAAGIYYLRLRSEKQVLQRTMVKQNN